ncbi:helix-turn-helix domain-containing protein [Celeribacter halophilus]|uniref:XRE family transcriptional regulator n=1 Tax=Celeribacter halophilus TaxID=576117 RepID=A0AAW7XUH7_9RHOB|nr:XRE family transcriptional regulator [Celeribacter halophilus]MBU2890888.1 XRE family transcriptional regulator [Celeribacter halophilus]MDO6457926.1 XRE family transcriptional regulator [Celeribacter halophilus]MDO6511228.1 XRE family transcriptional regulator [Celeribacter halophilus]MDO6722561.1 XRE family transcriptional regulator [Celeribacter halophilus]
MSKTENIPAPSDKESWETERHHLRAELGSRMKAVRQAAGLTLEAAAQKSGVALSTIHKIENGRVSPSYENLVRIARAYDIGMERLFSEDHDAHQTTRMTVTKAGQGRVVRAKHFEYEVLCNALAEKKIIPLVTTVEKRDALRSEDLESHTGEETLYVLSGRIELVVEHYKPVILEPGDCAYFDSTIKHGMRALDDTETKVFWACTYTDFAK